MVDFAKAIDGLVDEGVTPTEDRGYSFNPDRASVYL